MLTTAPKHQLIIAIVSEEKAKIISEALNKRRITELNKLTTIIEKAPRDGYFLYEVVATSPKLTKAQKAYLVAWAEGYSTGRFNP